MQPLFKATINVNLRFAVQINDITPERILQSKKKVGDQLEDKLPKDVWERAQHERHLLLALIEDTSIRDVLLKKYIIGSVEDLTYEHPDIIPEGSTYEGELINQVINRLPPDDIAYFAQARKNDAEFESRENFLASFEIKLSDFQFIQLPEDV